MGVMGFWDRQRTEELWTRAVAEIGIDGSGDSLEMMRRVSWERLLQVDCLQVYLTFTHIALILNSDKWLWRLPRRLVPLSTSILTGW